MIAPILRSKLEPIVATYRRFQLWRALTVCWCGMATLGGLLILLRLVLGLSGSILTWSLVSIAAVAGVVAWVLNRRRIIDYHWVAEQIETENPRLHTLLLAAVEQEPDPATGRLNYLQERVINEAIEENRRHPWHQKFSEKLVFARVAHVAALVRARVELAIAVGARAALAEAVVAVGVDAPVLGQALEIAPPRSLVDILTMKWREPRGGEALST